MPISSDLMKAILSMDSYNRGYDSGIIFGSNPGNNNYSLDTQGTTLGSASIGINSSIFIDNGDRLDADIGFYALSYTYGGETVISYRGTNTFILDPAHGWTLGAGNTDSEQGQMAIEFYNEVATADNGGTPIDPRLAGISTTGHSLGGGLAGYVSALYGKEAVVFDSMAFESSANNTSQYRVTLSAGGNQSSFLIDPSEAVNYVPPTGATLVSIVPEASNDLLLKTYDYNNTGNVNNADPWDVDISNISGYYINGEALGFNRLLQSSDIAPTPFNELDGIDLIPNSQGNITSESVARHDMAALVITMFKDEVPSLTDWLPSFEHMWPVLFNDTYASDIGFGNTTNTKIDGALRDGGKYSQILRQVIAYSAIDEGDDAARPFGDTAIRALYDDANDLGAALTVSGAGSTIEFFAEEISKVFVQFAGSLALADVEEAEWSAALDGVLTYDPADNSLIVDMGDDAWMNPDTSTSIVAGSTPQYQLVTEILNASGQDIFIRALMDTFWGDNSVNAVDRLVFGVDSALNVSIADGAMSETTMFVGAIGAYDVSGSNGSDMILGVEGENHFDGRGGDDILIGGVGNDTFVGGAGADFINGAAGFDALDYSSETAGITFKYIHENFSIVQEVTGTSAGTDTFESVEKFIGSAHDDTFYVDWPSEQWRGISLDAGDDVNGDTLFVDGGIAISFLADGSIETANGSVYQNFENVDGSANNYYINYVSQAMGVDYSNSMSLAYLSYALQTNSINADLAAGTVTSNGVSDTLDASNHLGLVGTSGDDVFDARGFDRLDTISAGMGDDKLYLDDDNRYVREYIYSGGNDTIYTSDINYGLAIHDIRLPIDVELADVTFQFINPTLISIVDGDITTQYDLKVNIAGHGSITFDGFLDSVNSSGAIADYPRGAALQFTSYRENGDFHKINLSMGTLQRSGYTLQSHIDTSYSGQVHGMENDDVINASIIGNNTIISTNGGDDYVSGTATTDNIHLGTGNDTALGGDGSDYIYGGFGNDDLDGGSGSDRVMGGAGDDILRYYVSENAGAFDFYYGGTGTDTLIVTFATSHERAQYADEIAGFEAHLTYHNAVGAEGNDYSFSFGNGLFLDDIENVIFVTLNDVGDNSDTLTGSDGDDNLNGMGGDDLIVAGAGNDILIGGQGTDTLNGGDGDDVADYTASTSRVIADLTLGTVIDGFGYVDAITSIEGINGSDYADSITGNADNNSFYGYDGNDEISGGAGNDQVVGGDGRDILIGGSGDDTVSGNDGDDVLDYILADNYTATDTYDGGAGYDRLRFYFTSAEYTAAVQAELQGLKAFLDANYDETSSNGPAATASSVALTISNIEEIDVFVDGAIDTSWFTPLSATTLETNGTADRDVIHGLNGINADEEIKGFAGDDLIYGNNGNDRIFGHQDDDTIYGGGGADTLYGDSNTVSAPYGGNDTIYGENGTDTIRGGDGDDFLDGGASADIIKGDYGNDVIYGGAGADTLFGDLNALNHPVGGNDLIYGGIGNDVLDGEAGDDHLYGEDNNDTLKGGDGRDYLEGGAGSDQLRGGAGKDRLVGNDGNDKLYGGDDGDILQGNEGFDKLFGEGGNDILYAGAGWDYLSGGDGLDTFIFLDMSDFTAGSGNQYNRILENDFNASEDMINIANILDTHYDPMADLLSDFVDVIDNGSDTYIRIDEDGTGSAAVMNTVLLIEGYTGHGHDADDMVNQGYMIV